MRSTRACLERLCYPLDEERRLDMSELATFAAFWLIEEPAFAIGIVREKNRLRRAPAIHWAGDNYRTTCGN